MSDEIGTVLIFLLCCVVILQILHAIYLRDIRQGIERANLILSGIIVHPGDTGLRHWVDAAKTVIDYSDLPYGDKKRK